MFKINNKADVFFTIIFFITLFMTLSIVIFNNIKTLYNNQNIGINNYILTQSIYEKGNIMVKYLKQYNSNGGGVLDIIGCPEDITMSGTTMSGTSISTNLTYDNGFIYCVGEYESQDFNIYFNDDFTDFTKVYYSDDLVSLSNRVGDRTFNDSDSTLISFSTDGISSDNIDDNFNSDNYRVDSEYGIYYPNGFQDDDIIPKKVLLGYIPSNADRYNIFWNNYKTNKIIDENVNNDDFYNLKIGDVEEAIIYLELKNDEENDYNLKIFEYDRQKYIEDNSIFPIDGNSGFNLHNDYGYIQKSSSGVVSVSKTITGDEFIFDFKNKDYGVFVTNNTSSDIVYRLSAESTTGTGIYITPIDDSDTETLELIVNDIVINNNINFIGDNIKIVYKK